MAKPGIYHGISADGYNAIPAVRATTLKRLHQTSAAHVHAQGPQSSTAMDNGSAFHCRILEPEHFHERFFSMPRFGRKKADTLAKAAFVEANRGKIEISQSDMQGIDGAAGRITTEPFVFEKLHASKVEVSLVWEEDFGLCKARLDALSEDQATIRDLKSTRDANPFWFSREIRWGYRYWIQAAWYYRGAKVLGLPVNEVEFLAIELKAPHGLTIHAMDEPELLTHVPEVLRLAALWAEAERTGIYPNYPLARHFVTIGGDEEDE